MKKVGRFSLFELQNNSSVINEESQKEYVGGGSGTSTDPYTPQEFDYMINDGQWHGGWVYGMGWVTPEVTVYGYYHRYSYEEYLNREDVWNGGYVEGYGYIGRDVTITTYDPNSLPKTGVYNYDMMYHSGFDLGYNAGKSGESWDDVLAWLSAALADASAGDSFGDVNYDMTYFAQGVREGYWKGKSSANYY